MIHIDKAEVYGWKPAFRGMRNPLDSWERSDSMFGVATETEYYNEILDDYQDKFNVNSDEESEKLNDWISDNAPQEWDNEAMTYACIGPKDIELAQKLISGGPVHSKFMRQIGVAVDIDAPLYW